MAFVCMILYSIIYQTLSAGFSTFPAYIILLAVAGLHRASPSATLDNKDLYFVLDTIA